jgi:hypothetical protein
MSTNFIARVATPSRWGHDSFSENRVACASENSRSKIKNQPYSVSAQSLSDNQLSCQLYNQ